MKPNKRTSLLLLTFAILVGVLAAAPLWGPGIVNTRGGGDSPFLLQRTLEMAENLRHGSFPARWMSHAAYDLGYPFFNHYGALPFYLSGGLTALGISPLLAIQATQTLGFVLASVFMLLWARRLFHNPAAVLLATTAYTFAPFHLVNVYVRGDSLSEFYAFIWYPLIFWALDRVAERPTRGRFAAATLAYSALILTHNVSVLTFSPFAGVYLLMRCLTKLPGEQRRNLRHLARAAGQAALPFVAGMLLTAWFWLPALAETRYGQMGPEFTAGYFHYTNHFRGRDLVQSSFLFDYDVALQAGEAGPFAMGLVQAILTLAGALVFLWRRRRRPAPLFCLGALLLATFMITPLSKPLWDTVPLLETTQFPWRLLSVQAFFAASVTGMLGLRPQAGTQSSVQQVARWVLIGGTLLLPMAATLPSLQPERLLITAEDVTWDALLLYESFTGNIGSTIRHEYLPAAVIPRLYISEAVVDGVNGARPIAEGSVPVDAELVERTPVKQVWRVALDEAAPVAFPLNWWPGWQASIGEAPVTTYPVVGSGRLAVDLEAGEHTVALQLRNTPLRTAAEATSVLATIAGLVAFAAGKQKITFPYRRMRHLALPVVVIALVSISPPALGLLAPTPEGLRVFDFNQQPFPHAGPSDFGEARLATARPPATIAPGETLSIPLTWTVTGNAPYTATLALVSPAEPRQNVPYTLAKTTFAVQDGITTVQLQLPDTLTRGLYLLELRVFGPAGELNARAAQGTGLGTLFIGAVRAPEGPALDAQAPVLGTFRDLTLHAVDTNQPDPTTLTAQLLWSSQGTPRNWSLSLRLQDAAGRHIVQVDPPDTHGYGYLPTTLWPSGEKVTDQVTLPLPEGLAPGVYTLRVITYLKVTGESGGELEVPVTLTGVTLREPGPALCEAGGLRLTALALPDAIQEGQPLDFEVTWNATAGNPKSLEAVWTLMAPDENEIARAAGPAAPGSDTATWPEKTWVRTFVHFDLPPTLPEGPYRLHLALVGQEQQLSACTLTTSLAVQLRERVFEIPDMPHAQVAIFDNFLQLLGYGVHHDATTLSLTVWWQATAVPPQDYKRFVHLFDPQTGALVAQDDAMPRDWTYPTSWWVEGEVVSETITLDLAAVPAGDYKLGVGWYDAAAGIPLPASDASGQSWPDDRVVLSGYRLQTR